jgi:hypothetical protein
MKLKIGQYLGVAMMVSIVACQSNESANPVIGPSTGIEKKFDQFKKGDKFYYETKQHTSEFNIGPKNYSEDSSLAIVSVDSIGVNADSMWMTVVISGAQRTFSDSVLQTESPISIVDGLFAWIGKENNGQVKLVSSGSYLGGFSYFTRKLIPFDLKLDGGTTGNWWSLVEKSKEPLVLFFDGESLVTYDYYMPNRPILALGTFTDIHGAGMNVETKLKKINQSQVEIVK